MDTIKHAILFAAVLSFAAGCPPEDTAEDPSENDTTQNSDGSDAGTTTADDMGSDPGDMTASGDTGGADMGFDMGSDDMGGPSHCPTDSLPSQATVDYSGSTIGDDNLFESNRLEWDDAGDDALLYVVPETGTYEFSMASDLTDNQGCGISISDMNGDFHTPTEDCPAEGMVRQLPDAFFVAGEGSSDTADLDAGQELLVMVSCASWSSPQKEVDYSITISKQ